MGPLKFIMEVVSKVRCCQGFQGVYKHESATLNCSMQFGVYVPDSATATCKLPVLFYLSGLTCTHANVMEKSGLQKLASQYGVIFVHPDTSPRGVDLPGDSDSWDFGKGAGFYVDATETPWSSHYKMYNYISQELPALIKKNFPADSNKMGILGHSMGGHGAMVIGLRNPEVFKTISAFAPISNPTNCPWGKKAFTGYLGSDEASWANYDSALLAKGYTGDKRTILVDQGTSDSFYTGGQLQPESLKSTDHVTFNVRLQPDYDHSYYFITSFLEDHFKHHVSQFASS